VLAESVPSIFEPAKKTKPRFETRKVCRVQLILKSSTEINSDSPRLVSVLFATSPQLALGFGNKFYLSTFEALAMKMYTVGPWTWKVPGIHWVFLNLTAI